MGTLFLCIAALSATPTPTTPTPTTPTPTTPTPTTPTPSTPSVNYPGASYPDGSIVYLRHSNKAVQIATDSDITHVALLIRDSRKRLWVYEATPARVRRIPLLEYHYELSRLNDGRSTEMQLYAMRPTTAYKQTQLGRMRSYLDDQLGRRYSVKGYVRGKESAGIHCAEFVSTALGKSGRAHFERNFEVTPGNLVERVSSVYYDPKRLKICGNPMEEDRTWCEQSWGGLTGWTTWCGWSMTEVFSWPW